MNIHNIHLTHTCVSVNGLRVKCRRDATQLLWSMSVRFLRTKALLTWLDTMIMTRKLKLVQPNYLMYFIEILPVVSLIVTKAKQNKFFSAPICFIQDQVSLGSFSLKQLFLSISLSFVTLTFFKGPGHLFCCMFFSLDLLDVFSWLRSDYAFLAGIPERGCRVLPHVSSQAAHMDLTWLRWYLGSYYLSLGISKHLWGHALGLFTHLISHSSLPNSFSLQWCFLLEILPCQLPNGCIYTWTSFLFICLESIFLFFSIFLL